MCHPSLTAAHATVIELTANFESVTHKLYTGNFISSPVSFDDLHTETISSCGTLRPSRKGMPNNFGQKMVWTSRLRWRLSWHSVERQTKCKCTDEHAFFPTRELFLWREWKSCWSGHITRL
jgi:hypothetical protein